MRPLRTLAALVTVGVGLLAAALGPLASSPAAVAAPSSACPSTVDPAAFAGASDLRALTKVMDDLGPRPTASPAQLEYIESIESELADIGGMTVSALPEQIDLQLDRRASLSLGGVSLPVAGAVPYAKPTGGAGVTGRLVAVPAGTAISATDVSGAIVVRKAATGMVQHAIFGAVAYFLYDPDLTVDPLANYERDNFGYLQRVTDLREAAEGGAAGLVFVHDFPTEQVRGQYAPYEGERWQVPAVYVGADEGARLEAAATGGSTVASLRTTASRRMADTRSVIATLPGRSDERIVIQSHTDGMNAVWDNGPAAMLALARYFASLPLACRPRTLQFVFTTAHLHLSQSGAYRFAGVLDDEYETGTVALVVAIEHLGAKEFAAVPRGDGGPGRRLEPSGRSELLITFAMESPVLVDVLIDRIVAHDLRRSFVLRGADAPRVGFPPHRSFGGEGGPYREHLVPTVAGITGPWTLYDPSFPIDDLVDFDLMRRQTLAFGDLVLAVDDVPRQVLAGADNVYRPARDLLGQDPAVPVPVSTGGSPSLVGHDHATHTHGLGVGELASGDLSAASGPSLGRAAAAVGLWSLVALAVVRGFARRRRRYHDPFTRA